MSGTVSKTKRKRSRSGEVETRRTKGKGKGGTKRRENNRANGRARESSIYDLPVSTDGDESSSEIEDSDYDGKET